MKNLRVRLIALLAVLVLVVAACGGDDDAADDTGADETQATEAPDDSTDDTEAPAETTTTAAMADEPSALPGEGVSVTMGRADWSTGYFQAAVYQQLLQELGYDVSDPAELELGPSLAYLSMAQGDFDFWVNSWYPGHISWWEPELPDGSRVGDHLYAFGPAPDTAGAFPGGFSNTGGELVAGGPPGLPHHEDVRRGVRHHDDGRVQRQRRRDRGV